MHVHCSFLSAADGAKQEVPNYFQRQLNRDEIPFRHSLLRVTVSRVTTRRRARPGVPVVPFQLPEVPVVAGSEIIQISNITDVITMFIHITLRVREAGEARYLGSAYHAVDRDSNPAWLDQA